MCYLHVPTLFLVCKKEQGECNETNKKKKKKNKSVLVIIIITTFSMYIIDLYVNLVTGKR